MMKLHFIRALIISVYLFQYSSSNTIFESVVKVSAGRSNGTGSCINEDENYFYFMTNKHVVGNSSTANLFFYRDGFESRSIPAQIVWTAYRANEPVDIAILRVSKSSLDGWTPKIIRFDLNDNLYKKGDTIMTIGCPEAQWPRAYKGHIVSTEGGCYKFIPTVIPGQSGSLLLNGDGTKAIGLIAWYEGNYGKAMNREVLEKAAFGQHTNYYYKQPYKFDSLERLAIPAQYYYYTESCGPYGCFRRPLFGQRSPRPQKPPFDNPQLEPDQILPDQSQPDGSIIFPDYPGDQGDEFTPPDDPDQPKDDNPKIPPLDLYVGKFEAINSRLDALEKDDDEDDIVHQELKNQMAEINNQLSNLNASIQDYDVKFNDFSSTVSQKLAQLETQINTKPTPDAITPGKLNDFLKDTDIIKTMQETQAQYIDTQSFNSVAGNLNNEIKAINDKVNQKIAEQSASDKEILAAILANKPQDVVAPNIVYDYGQTAISAGIPSIVLLILGYYAKKLWAEFKDKLEGRLGGAVNVPFQTPEINK